jgi:uncharacterized protein with NRDE domain
MCTIVCVHDPGRSLVVAANRDELLNRPFAPPRRWPDGFVAGVDLLAGGTWMGATAGGFFAGLTNVRPAGGADRLKRSRGSIVAAVLVAADPAAFLSALDPREYNPFHLLFGDATGLRVASAPPGAAALTIADVPAGVHVLPNGPLDGAGFPKVARARALADSDVPGLLADHALGAVDPFVSICVHTPFYGTRSSTILVLEPGRTARYQFAPGPPCVTGYDDVTALF